MRSRSSPTRCARPASRQSSWRSLAAPRPCGRRAEQEKENYQVAKTKHPAKTEKKKTKDGHVSQVIGAVVHVEFPPGEQPELFEALEVKTQDGRTVVLELEDAIGDTTVRTIALDATHGFRRRHPAP